MFEFVSKETWLNFNNGKNVLKTTLENYPDRLPIRSTERSAGYDFFSPFDISVEIIDDVRSDNIIIPTGIKWNPNGATLKNKPIITSTAVDDFQMTNYINTLFDSLLKSENIVLQLYPRSSLGFKYGFKFANTIPVIDADYYNNPDNEGHIVLNFSTTKNMQIHRGDKICQGIMLPFFTFDDKPTDIRTGGIGSTGK